MVRVLFVYHNRLEEGYMPLNISILSGMLKREGIETSLFDTTFYRDIKDLGIEGDKEIKEKLGQYKKVSGYGIQRELVDLKIKFIEVVKKFKPDLIAATSTTLEFNSLAEFVLPAKKKFNIPFIIGGSHATVVPEKALQDEAVDIVCIGEGEKPLLELAKRIGNNESYDDIPSLWIKKNNEIIKNKLWKDICTMDELPESDWDLFDERHRIRPFEGEMKTYGFWELSRGCPFNCSYCINSKLHKIQREGGINPGTYRYYSPEVIIKRMEKYKKKYNYNHVQFIDENMATMPLEDLKKLAKLYKEKINLGFFTQSRPEWFVFQPEKAEIMADMGCKMVGIGVESGNEELRKTILNRPMKDGIVEEAVKNLKKAGIMVAAYYIIGFPTETKEMIKETIALHDRIKPHRHSIRFLHPFPGTPLRELCIKEGYMEDDLEEKEQGKSFLAEPVLDLPSPPHPTKEELIELRNSFKNYSKNQ